MTYLLLVGCGAFVALLALSAHVFTTMLRPAKQPLAHPATPLNLAPLERLLAAADFDFLKRQPGFRPEMLSAMRGRRASLFQSYLGQVELEFHRLHRQIRLLTLQSGFDSPELAKALVQQRLTFSWRLLQVRFRLTIFRFGLHTFPHTGLAQVIDQMREQVAQIQQFSAAATFAA